MADFLDAINFLEIQNAKSGTRNEARLRDLEGHANFIAKKTGQEPVSWYEFSREVPPEQNNNVTNALIGAGAGAVMLGGIASVVAAPVAVPAIISGVILGGLLGGYHKTENTSRSKQVDAYEKYLNQFELGVTLGAAKEPAISTQMAQNRTQETAFTEALIAERETEKKKDGCGCSKGK